jgi:hypothetical protein
VAHTLLAWLEGSPLGHVMRGSGVWMYAIVNLAHIVGVSTLFGSILVLDLRLLGLWRRVPIAALASAASPLATAGFLLAAPTGLGLLATKGTEYAGNPFLLIKFAAIGLGLINVLVVRRSRAWRARDSRPLAPSEERQLATMGGLSLVSWFTALAAGRMIGYW